MIVTNGEEMLLMLGGSLKALCLKRGVSVLLRREGITERKTMSFSQENILWHSQVKAVEISQWTSLIFL